MTEMEMGMESFAPAGVTVVSPTMRPQLMKQLLDNYARQQGVRKELIIVLNRKGMSMKRYKRAASAYDNVRVLRIAGRRPLGDCLNYAASRARYPYIAKFDDDDYYGPLYLSEAVNTFRVTKADLVGKSSFFFYFPHRQTLLLRRQPFRPYSGVKRIAGATIMFHQRVFKRVKFGKKRQGSDVQFIRACLRKGFRLRTSSRYHFAAIRRANRMSHTWKVRERQLFADRRAMVIRTKQFKLYVNRQRALRRDDELAD
ncbi:glycosyl transferase family 2 [Paenibacillus curdlanolyticus YK9]|uniref:Glycosyl transferase family 2 n=1 Tax=Paenibacillus curdlanolyticus YK9 TaxID=717606 RepID=E0IAL1_9BACL|nr:glycosyltransferase [Paenibacillus curdlanolyticus]EFM10415.1 glycosyl transferase family 2 [Paenibacillus curdlanolyticus YK9]